MTYKLIYILLIFTISSSFKTNVDKNTPRSFAQIEDNHIEPDNVEIRLAAYNVLFGIWGTPKRIGEMFKPYNLDVICFSEVPDGDWTSQVGETLGMNYSYVGKISSANHTDKFKSILSRTPLFNKHEIEINAEGWSPSSMVGSETIIQGKKLLIYSLHIPGRPYFTDKVHGSAAEYITRDILPEIKNERVVIMGDLNSHIGDGPMNLFEKLGYQSTWIDLNIDVKQKSTHQHIESGTQSGVLDHILYYSKVKVEVIDGAIINDAYNPPNEEKSMPRYYEDWKKYGKPLSDHRPIWASINWE